MQHVKTLKQKNILKNNKDKTINLKNMKTEEMKNFTFRTSLN
jgi:hypothetical protein